MKAIKFYTVAVAVYDNDTYGMDVETKVFTKLEDAKAYAKRMSTDFARSVEDPHIDITNTTYTVWSDDGTQGIDMTIQEHELTTED